MSAPALALPTARAEIARIQSERKRAAFAAAKKARWYKGRLDGIDADRLDRPEEWAKIPILTKDILRTFTHREFMDALCIAPPTEIAEYWRSGGTTGKPVFYPRTFADVRYGLLSWGRSFPCIGIGAGDLVHISFPLGVHPAGQIWARSAYDFGVGMTWAGAGNAMPSRAQLDLITNLRPSVLIAMSSYALHLANVAEAENVDLAAGSVRIVICSAETLSAAKREKIGRMWGAEVYDVFGMSEAGLMGAEGAAHDGIHIWTDMFYVEVVDPDSGLPLKPGEVGRFCVTPLWTGHATPFLRWDSGDLVSFIEQGESSGPYASVFPMIRHAQRTSGFFKIRGVNVNHAEFEDFMFSDREVTDFQAVLETDADALETLKLRLELARGIDTDGACARIAQSVRRTFEVTPTMDVLERGTLARDFESAIKAPRFVDRRT